MTNENGNIFARFWAVITGANRAALKAALAEAKRAHMQAELEIAGVERHAAAVLIQAHKDFAAEKLKITADVKDQLEAAKARLSEALKDAEPAIKVAVDAEITKLIAAALAALA